MMKVFLITFFAFANVYANDVSPGGAQQVDTDSQVEVNSGMAKLMEHPKVEAAVGECEKVKADNEKAGVSSGAYAPFKDLGDCIWGHISEADRGDINQFLETQEQERNSKVGYDGKDLGTEGVQITEEMKALQAAMVKKIEEGTYGTGEKKNVVGHEHYYAMAKNAYGKNLVQAGTYFCMNTRRDSIHYIFDDSPSELEEGDDPNDPNNANKLSAQDKWMKELKGDPKQASQLAQVCMTHIQDICYDNYTDQFIRQVKESGLDASPYESLRRSGGDDHQFSFKKRGNDPGDKDVANATSNGDQYCTHLARENQQSPLEPIVNSKCSDDFAKTRRVACTVARQMKENRASIQAIDKITAQFEKIAQGGATGIVMQQEGSQEEQLQRFNPDAQNGTSINHLTTFSTKELIDDSEYTAKIEAKQDRFNDCWDAEKNELKNTDSCEEFVNTDKAERERMIAEFVLRRRTLEVKMAEDFEDEQKLEQAILEQGYSKEEAADLMAIEDGKFIKEQLRKRFAAESDALHNQLLEKMRKDTIKGSEISKTDDQKLLDDISKDLSSNVNRMRQLIRFNNVVSGYFQIGTGDDARSNLVPLETELTSIDDEDFKRRINESMPSLTDGSSDENNDDASLDDTTVRDVFLNVKRRPSED